MGGGEEVHRRRSEQEGTNEDERMEAEALTSRLSHHHSTGEGKAKKFHRGKRKPTPTP